MNELTAQIANLKNVTERLSWDSLKQREYLEKLGTFPLVDELALEFGDVVVLVPNLLQHEMLTPVAVRGLKKVEEQLSIMSDRAEVWTPEALANAVEWKDLRSLAKQALVQLMSE